MRLLAFVVSIVVSGIPLDAVHGMPCDAPSTHCGKLANVSHCARTTKIAPCCHTTEQPASTNSNAAREVMKPAVAAYASALLAAQACRVLILARADYAFARGRQSVSIPILHAALLI